MTWFNTEVSNSFRENILSKGSVEDADVLYRNFRGHDPQPEALMKKLGALWIKSILKKSLDFHLY